MATWATERPGDRGEPHLQGIAPSLEDQSSNLHRSGYLSPKGQAILKTVLQAEHPLTAPE